MPRKSRWARKTVYHFFRVSLGFVFVLSAGLKILSPLPFSSFISQILNLNGQTAFIGTIIISTFELLIGSLLLINKNTLLASSAASVLLLTSIAIGTMLIGSPLPCGCFGEFLQSKTDEYYLVRNTLLLLIALVTLRFSSTLEYEQDI